MDNILQVSGMSYLQILKDCYVLKEGPVNFRDKTELETRILKRKKNTHSAVQKLGQK